MEAHQVRRRNRLYFFLLLWPVCVSAFLNLEELNEMKYEIQILPDPVIMGQTNTDEVMMVSSKYKQLYECRLPAQAVRFHQDPVSDPDSQGYTGPDILDLLSPMREPPCLVLTKDWWTYEFCHGQHIKQYHLEDSEIKGDVLFLGYYESEFDWSNETAKASKQHRLKRFHSQTYVNGSKCDINGNPREAEVRFVCEDGSGDYIARVDEPQSCRYVVTIHTSRTCQHPFLRPPSTAKPQGIVCQPALSAQQYMDYVKAQVSDTKRKVEQISEELRSLDEMLAGNEEAPAEGTAEETSSDPNEGRDQSDQKDIADGSDGAGSEDPEDTQFWEGIAKPESSKTSSSREESEAADDGLNSLTDNEVLDDGNEAENFNFKIITDPSDLMKFVQHLKESNRKKAQNRAKEQAGESESVKRGKDDGEDDEDERLLQEFKDEMADISVPADKADEIQETMRKEFDNIINEAQQELETEGLKGEFDRTQATQALETTLDKLFDHLEEKDEHEQDHKKPPAGAQKANDPTRGSPSLAPKQPGKIEVKILTRKNTDEAGDQWLTEEDTKSFRELLINLLTGGTEEVHKEQKRQQELEDNYRFVWGEGQEESQSSSNSDSDDVDL
ncbi:protein OS-9 isoform X2 [Hippocampus zosterae]|uniref:protein OS-9 isoform X2 n=1 Tax=Hippocampus zosterae TaxID=109293 RepID=UPI00223D21B2|nr:protein OS-9 isoform X2 [Hippocampus zosterae]